MKSKAHLLVFDGLADWEPAHALCEISKSGKFEVVTTGFGDRPVTTMGGLRVTPEITLNGVDPDDAAVFIMPGGEMWEKRSDQFLIELLGRLERENVLIAAICGATLEAARAGLTRGVRHTSNGKEYLKTLFDGYGDEEFYVDQLAVSDGNLITASGLGSVEFAREIIGRLGIYDEAERGIWFDMFKHGVLP
jgi:putative intracellular protease/amidase